MSNDTHSTKGIVATVNKRLADWLAENDPPTEVERLRAASVVLDSIVDALVDPNRPEESPVDAVRRIIAARNDAQREVCERRSRDHGPRYGDDAQFATKARNIAAALGWDCYGTLSGDQDADIPV